MVDLHTHSTFSDGTLSPTELIKLANEIGLSAIALTDHNTVLGLEEFKRAGVKYGVETVSGIEISTQANDEEFHILALFIKQKHYKTIENYLKTTIDRKIQSNKSLVHNLILAGYNISYEQIIKDIGTENFNRVPIANALVNKGYANSIKEAFDGLLNEKSGFYCPPKRLDTFETIKFINSIGAVSVWAHPLKDTTPEKLDNIYLPMAKKAGLVAIETMHSSYIKEQITIAENLAHKYDLLFSGGSDFHGDNKKNILLGTGYNNNVSVSDESLYQLKKVCR